LIADDESVVRDIARRLLEDAGYRVLEACDGVEAVQLLQDGAQIDVELIEAVNLLVYGHVNKPRRKQSTKGRR